MSEKELLAYTAGIIDGEGTFYRANQKNGLGYRNPQSRIIVIQTDMTLLEFLHTNFGGHITGVSSDRSPLSHKPCYRWVLLGKAAEVLAIRLHPYLIVKREQVKKILDFPRFNCKHCGKEFYKESNGDYCHFHKRMAVA